MHDFYAGWCTMSPLQNCYLVLEVEENSNPGLASRSSLDLNTIENLWTVLKDKVSEIQPTNSKELEEAIKAVWVLELSAQYCRSLMESMRKRLEAAAKAKGGPIKY